jgi:hypothetical protein
MSHSTIRIFLGLAGMLVFFAFMFGLKFGLVWLYQTHGLAALSAAGGMLVLVSLAIARHWVRTAPVRPPPKR